MPKAFLCDICRDVKRTYDELGRHMVWNHGFKEVEWDYRRGHYMVI